MRTLKAYFDISRPKTLFRPTYLYGFVMKKSSIVSFETSERVNVVTNSCLALDLVGFSIL